MATKYKFILTIPYYDGTIEIDSAEEIEDVWYCGNYSQAEPHCLKGIFDTYEEAKQAATEQKIYKFLIESYDSGYCTERIDSLKDYGEPLYFVNYWLAEDCAIYRMDPFESQHDFGFADFMVYQHKKGNKKKGIPAGAFTYKIIGMNKVCYYNSALDGIFYDTQNEAYDKANKKSYEYRINYLSDDESCFRIEEIPIIDFRIEEIDV